MYVCMAVKSDATATPARSKLAVLVDLATAPPTASVIPTATAAVSYTHLTLPTICSV